MIFVGRGKGGKILFLRIEKNNRRLNNVLSIIVEKKSENNKEKSFNIFSYDLEKEFVVDKIVKPYRIKNIHR